MLVKYWMRRPVITLEAKTSIKTAMRRMEEADISYLPVVRTSRPIGIVTRDALEEKVDSILSASSLRKIQRSFQQSRIEEIMQREFKTVPLDCTIEETAVLMLSNDAPGIMVVDCSGVLFGVITRSDILRVLVDLTGVARRGVQYAFYVEDRPGSVQELINTIRSYGGRLVSILTSSEGEPSGYRKAYIRICGIDRFRLISLNEALRARAEMIYVMDRLDVCREIREPIPL